VDVHADVIFELSGPLWETLAVVYDVVVSLKNQLHLLEDLIAGVAT